MSIGTVNFKAFGCNKVGHGACIYPHSGSSSGNIRQRFYELPADKPKVVLVVDDECVIADTLAIILNQHGFEASAAYNGIEAVEQAHRLRPDVIICDVIMPNMNGIEAAILVREISSLLQNPAFQGRREIGITSTSYWSTK